MRAVSCIAAGLLLLGIVFLITDCSMGHWSRTEHAVVTAHIYHPPYTTFSTDSDGNVEYQNHDEEFVIQFKAETFTGAAEVFKSYWDGTPDGTPIYARQRIGGISKRAMFNQIVPNPELP